MSRLTITLPQKTLQYVSSIATRDNESLSKVINRLLQVGMHYMHAEERARPGKHYYQQLMIQSYVLIKQLAADILKYEKQDFDELKEAATKKAHELKESAF